MTLYYYSTDADDALNFDNLRVRFHCNNLGCFALRCGLPNQKKLESVHFLLELPASEDFCRFLVQYIRCSVARHIKLCISRDVTFDRATYFYFSKSDRNKCCGEMNDFNIY